MDPNLTPAEEQFWTQCLDLFALVNASYPERGIRSLMQRAKKQTGPNLPYNEALEQEYQAAKVRTEARLKLLGQCSIESKQ